jgi:hypothetical protein
MNDLIKNLSHDRTIWWSTLIAVILLLLCIILVAIFYGSLPPFIPLFNQLPWGTERLSSKTSLLLPVLVAFIIVACNSILTKYIYERMSITARMLAVTTLLLSVLVFIFVIRIIQIIL